MSLESKYQKHVIDSVKEMFPEAVVLKNDPTYLQGIPDLVIFYKNKYAMLEVKRASNASHRPNQDYYVNMFSDWAFSSFIYPENEREVFDGLQRAFKSARKARLAKS